MLYLVIFLCIFIIFFLILLPLPMQLFIKLKGEGINYKADLILKLFKIKVFGITFPKIPSGRKKNKKRANTKEIFGVNSLKKLYRVWEKQTKSKKIVIEEIIWEIDIGTGQADTSAILSGVVWTVWGILFSYLSKKFKIRNHKEKVNTVFDNAVFRYNLHCIIKFKLVNIILVVAAMVLGKKKSQKKYIGGDISG